MLSSRCLSVRLFVQVCLYGVVSSLLEVLRWCLCKEFVLPSRRFSLGCYELYLLDVYLYISTFLVTGIANVKRLEGFSRRV